MTEEVESERKERVLRERCNNFVFSFFEKSKEKGARAKQVALFSFSQHPRTPLCSPVISLPLLAPQSTHDDDGSRGHVERDLPPSRSRSCYVADG